MEYTLPVIKHQPRLVYPEQAAGMNYYGAAKIYLNISEQGIVEKVTLLESSGHKILDDAALDYCKEIEFEPAKKGGENVRCRMVQKVNFNLLDEDFSFDNYITRVKNLYGIEKDASKKEETRIQNEILKKHIEFVHKMSNVVSFNSALEKVILTETKSEWNQAWDNYPLTFLLFHDFIQRFPNYDSLEIVKNYLSEALKSDLEFINKTKTHSTVEEKTKVELVTKIKRFIEEKYPEIHIKEYPLTADLNF
ncbi:MAG: energy transducer TonB [Melioribacteraceae bacterium]|nr:energy transducer TonB [Melioribacteraceae bacterium]